MAWRGRKVTYEGVTYASGFEAEIAKWLVEHGHSFEYESLRIDYWDEVPRGYCAECMAPRPRVNRSYTPDFILPNGVIIETKGRFTAADRKKHAFIKEQHPDLDIRILFKYDNHLSKKAKKRYSQWCASKDIPCAVYPAIPREWFASGRRKSSANIQYTGSGVP